MAQRMGAGGYFQPLDHVDDHGLSRPSSRGGGGGGGGGSRPMFSYDDYSEGDSDDTSPYSPRPQIWGQRHDRDRGIPELRWSPSPEPEPEPEHQFFIIREGTPATPPRELQHLQPNDHRQHQYHHPHSPLPYPHPPPPPPPPQQPPRENAHSPGPIACFMERTDSGRTIVTEPELLLLLPPSPNAGPHSSLSSSSSSSSSPSSSFSHKEDSKAAQRVQQHLAKPHARGNVKRHERILRTLINPRAKATDFPLDNAALESIFSAADEIFFQGRLSRRVHWEWSSGQRIGGGGGGDGGDGGIERRGSGSGGGGRIIGTTALRAAEGGGYETLIMLSSPILKDTSYNRRLLISTFLHELIHSYLFICCGFKARHCGGHTEGFKAIAGLIDRWEGQGSLRLCDMEADLEHFREEQQQQPPPPPPPVLLRNSMSSDSAPEFCHHHHSGGGSGGGRFDFYDLKKAAPPWSTGPKVVFGAGHGQAMEGRWSTGSLMPNSTMTTTTTTSGGSISLPLSSASTLLEHGEWGGGRRGGGYDGPDAVARSLDLRSGHTFLRTAMNPFPLQ